ncbi:tetratricopeptide repeat protein [Marinilactibacillus psychrotolerans]|uniref:Tetratricopeptide repeat protein n=3 Tax=Marinilactibacillus psychrotolerans TaxID=191770 RepID=A0A5R9C5K4_9LACT|nr:hypothetical protein [Marinilactibacillus psychrotolerans]TLQ08283.1 hypothetical protein FEZ48_04420 [Marinilactibacillus psychrotolerans]GEQ32682.1 hypothetical protein B795N_05640 [Marinilactibacillus psychrotolerans]SJN20639.1 hypothetical protein FM115_01630 [Marinilactibacillus psychrotolerans 42ea]
MGEKIEFPNNYSMYLKNAEIQLKKNEPIKALHYIELAYAINKELNINAFYVSVLVQLERYEEALEIFEDFKEINIKKIEHLSLYVHLLIKNQRFIQAEAFLAQLKDTGQIAKKELMHMEKLLEKELQIEEQQRMHKKNELKKKLFALSDLAREEQLKIVDEVNLLSSDELARAIPFVMNNPFVDSLAKSFYLQNLVSLNVDINFEFETLGISRSINPAKLNTFNEEPMVVEINRQLDIQLEKNPSMLMSIKPELNFHLLKMYPFAMEIVDNPIRWVELYIYRYSHESEEFNYDLEFSSSEKKMMEWIKKLGEIES